MYIFCFSLGLSHTLYCMCFIIIFFLYLWHSEWETEDLGQRIYYMCDMNARQLFKHWNKHMKYWSFFPSLIYQDITPEQTLLKYQYINSYTHKNAPHPVIYIFFMTLRHDMGIQLWYYKYIMDNYIKCRTADLQISILISLGHL